MVDEVASTDQAVPVEDPVVAKPRRRRFLRWPGRRGDLRIFPFPPVETLVVDREHLVDTVRAWAEQQAEVSIDWYLQDKRVRRVQSRIMRLATVLLFVAGGMIPLINVARNLEAGGWGYVAFAAAAGVAAFDHFFGLSSGWLRDMAAAQALQRRLTEFRLGWATAMVVRQTPADAGRDAAQAELLARLDLVNVFALDVIALVEAETAEWLAEFRSGMAKLYSQVGLPHRAS